MSMSEDQHKAFEAYYESLSPEERRQRIVLQPAFRDAYNEITEAHRSVQVPRYFWTKWVPMLGPVAATLYMQLRQYCYYNPKTGEVRNLCWPKQATLAQEIGVKDEKTIRKALALLEEHGFIKREHTYYRDADAGLTRKGTDRYLVYFEVPLVTEDAVELLIRQSGSAAATADECNGKKSPYTPEGVENPGCNGKKSPYLVGEKIPHRTSTRTSTYNVNVGGANQAETGRIPRQTPAVHPEERAEREALAAFIGDQLKTMVGRWDGQDHKSARFHRRVALVMPQHLVQDALAATRDAVEDERSGRKSLREGPDAYFAGTVRRIAEREGIDLGVTWGANRAPQAAGGPQNGQERRR
jgi:hypothetical protein